jgi:hypothetical protein
MGNYDIDYNKLVPQLMPVTERTGFNTGWLKALVSPVVYLYNQFIVYRKAVLYNLAHNSQVPYMEAVLNDTFDAVDRGIYISDPMFVDPVYVYRANELKPVWLGLVSEEGTTPYPDPVPLYMVSECYGLGGVQFQVNVPWALVYDTDRMKAVINAFRLASKSNYKIVTY